MCLFLTILTKRVIYIIMPNFGPFTFKHAHTDEYFLTTSFVPRTSVTLFFFLCAHFFSWASNADRRSLLFFLSVSIFLFSKKIFGFSVYPIFAFFFHNYLIYMWTRKVLLKIVRCLPFFLCFSILKKLYII